MSAVRVIDSSDDARHVVADIRAPGRHTVRCSCGWSRTILVRNALARVAKVRGAATEHLRNVVFASYAIPGGPTPARGSGSIASAFWRGYEGPADQPGLRGGDPRSPAGLAFAAGAKRRAAEGGA